MHGEVQEFLSRSYVLLHAFMRAIVTSMHVSALYHHKPAATSEEHYMYRQDPFCSAGNIGAIKNRVSRLLISYLTGDRIECLLSPLQVENIWEV